MAQNLFLAIELIVKEDLNLNCIMTNENCPVSVCLSIHLKPCSNIWKILMGILSCNHVISIHWAIFSICHASSDVAITLRTHNKETDI